MTHSTPEFRIEDDPAPSDIETLLEELAEFNRGVAGHEGYRPLACFVRDPDGTIAGGISASTHHGWLSINLVWLREDLRGQGLGSRMLAAVEQEAIRRGCTRAHLDTHEFQAPGFYAKRGYEVFGELPDFPTGYRRLFMSKQLG